MDKAKMTNYYGRALLIAVFLLALASPVVCNPAGPAERQMSYEGFQVHRLTSDDPLTLSETLEHLEQQSMVDVWSRGSRSADVIVAPKHISYVRKRSADRGIRSDVIVEDLQSELQKDFVQRQRRRKRSVLDVTSRYLAYDEMQAYLYQVAREATNASVTVDSIGLSYENRNVSVIGIRERAYNLKPKQAILIDAGIHAREWIAPAMALNIVNKLAFGRDQEARRMLQLFDWFIVPCVNPDGYVFSMSSATNRMWRKTRTKQYNARCYGVDGNRNFGYEWNPAIGGSTDYCSDVYSGPHAFSEPETRNIRDWLESHRNQAVAYVTMHSYGEYILYPYGSSRNKPVADKALLETLGTSFKQELQKAGHNYKVGNSATLLYPAAGGSDDYAKGTVGIKVSYTLELSPASSTGGGFQLSKNKIRKVVEDTWPGFTAMANKLYTELNPQSSSGAYLGTGDNSVNGRGRIYFNSFVDGYLKRCCEQYSSFQYKCCTALGRSVGSG